MKATSLNYSALVTYLGLFVLLDSEKEYRMRLIRREHGLEALLPVQTEKSEGMR